MRGHQELVKEPPHAGDLGANEPKALALIQIAALLPQIGKPHLNASQRIAQFMGNPSRHFPDGRQPIRLGEFNPLPQKRFGGCAHPAFELCLIVLVRAERLGERLNERELLASARFQRAANSGARAQRFLFASTGTKDPKAADTLYVDALAAPFTINTMPEGTLKAFADHGKVGAPLAADGGDSEIVLASFTKAGIDIDALAVRLQDEGAASFVKSWNDLMTCIESKSAQIRNAG